MATQDRIRLTGLLREPPLRRGFLFGTRQFFESIREPMLGFRRTSCSVSVKLDLRSTEVSSIFRRGIFAEQTMQTIYNTHMFLPAAAPAVTVTPCRLKLENDGRSGKQSALMGRRAG